MKLKERATKLNDVSIVLLAASAFFFGMGMLYTSEARRINAQRKLELRNRIRRRPDPAFYHRIPTTLLNMSLADKNMLNHPQETEATECIICYKNVANIIFAPCNHLLACH